MGFRGFVIMNFPRESRSSDTERHRQTLGVRLGESHVSGGHHHGTNVDSTNKHVQAINQSINQSINMCRHSAT